MPLSRAVNKALVSFGVTGVSYDNINRDPTTQEEFNLLIFSNAPPSLTWESLQTEVVKAKQSIAINDLRNYRNILLQQSDWIMQFDVVNTIENINDWIAYRQQLRDLPETLTEYIWLNSDVLDFRAMNIPQPPPVIRKNNNS